MEGMSVVWVAVAVLALLVVLVAAVFPLIGLG